MYDKRIKWRQIEQFNFKNEALSKNIKCFIHKQARIFENAWWKLHKYSVEIKSQRIMPNERWNKAINERESKPIIIEIELTNEMPKFKGNQWLVFLWMWPINEQQ